MFFGGWAGNRRCKFEQQEEEEEDDQERVRMDFLPKKKKKKNMNGTQQKRTRLIKVCMSNFRQRR
jgi:hypothetical protein